MNHECDYTSSDGRDSNHEKLAADLQEKFEDELLNGEYPDPQHYLDLYTGPDKQAFTSDLEIARILLSGAHKQCQQWNALDAAGRLDKVKQRGYEKLFGKDQRGRI